MATDTTQTDAPVEETPAAPAPESPATTDPAPQADVPPASPANSEPTEPTSGPDTPPVEDSPVQPEVVNQENSLEGDQAIADGTDPSVEVAVVNEATAAQVSPPRQAPAATVPVNEVHVTTDRVVTDPSSPEAVLVPDAGRSPLLTQGLPIARLNAPTVESIFAAEASEVNEDNASSVETGRAPNPSAD